MALPYDDVLDGTMCDKHGTTYILFTRYWQRRWPGHNSIHSMAQQDSRVFALQVTLCENADVIVTLTDGSGRTSQLRPKCFRDAYHESTGKFLALSAVACQLFPGVPGGNPSRPDGFWNSLSLMKLEEARILLNVDNPFPDSFLSPKGEDTPCCKLYPGQGVVLTLFIRRIFTKPLQEFVMAIDQQRSVYFVTQLDLRGLLLKFVVLSLRREDGKSFPMKIPYFDYTVVKQEDFKGLLAQACVKKLPLDRFDDLPKNIFGPTTMP